MKVIRIAILSDLHCRHDKEGVTTYLYSDAPRIPMDKHPIQALKAIIEKDKLNSDYVICPGDISDKIDIQGLVSGYGFVNEIKADLNASELFCVPGNHDVDSRKKYAVDTPFDILRRYILDYPLKDSKLLEKFWANNYVIFKDDKIKLLMINSVFNHFDTANAQKSVISEKLLSDISNELSSETDEELFKIAVCHHHPVKISNIDPTKYKDGDSLENGDVLLKKLSEHKFHLFIHGHKHTPQLSINNYFPVFSSGSFSSLENIIESPFKNCFHIIELYLENGACKGKIDTWFYTCGKGWAKSKDPDEAFPTLTGFGVNADITELASKINQWFTSREKDRIRYEEVLNNFGDIQFLSPLQQKVLSDELLKLQLEFNPTLTVGAKELSKQLI